MDEEDEYTSYYDDEEIIEDFLYEFCYEKMQDFVMSEYVEFWDYTKQVVPVEFFSVNLKSSFEYLEIMHAYKNKEPKVRRQVLGSYPELEEYEVEVDTFSYLSNSTKDKNNLLLKF